MKVSHSTQVCLNILSQCICTLSPSLDVRCYPGSEDFGAVTASTSVTANAGSSTFSSPSHHRRNTVSRVLAPATPIPTPCQTPTPNQSSAQIFTLTHGRFPLILSSRAGVGFPDYTHHPLFIQPGVSRVPLGQLHLNLLSQVSQVLISTLRQYRDSLVAENTMSSPRVCM